ARHHIAEIGSWHGRSTKALAEACPGTVFAVDHFQGSPGDASFVLAEAEAVGAGNDARTAFHKNLKAELETGKVRILEMESSVAATRVPTPVDMVFLDGAHDEKSVRRDIRSWLPLLRKGGLLCGHDAIDPRVQEALNAEVPEWKSGPDSIWFVEV